MTAETVTIRDADADGTDGENSGSGAALRRTDLSPVAEAGGAARAVRRIRPLLRVVLPVALIALWYVGTTIGVLSTQMLSSPGAVVGAYRELWESGELQQALAASLGRSVKGLALGTVVGIGFGLLAGLSRLGEEVFDSSLQMLRTIPFMALIPLFMLWFGIGEEPKVALITAACIFPNYLNTYAGVRSVDPKIIEAGRVFGLSKWLLVKRIVLPAALPHVLVGFRYAMGVSLLALIAAEQINAGVGLGYLVMNANTVFRSDIIIAGVLIFAALGLTIDAVMRFLERLLVPWRPKVVK
jgi:sulfonate transport system permease protein